MTFRTTLGSTKLIRVDATTIRPANFSIHLAKHVRRAGTGTRFFGEVLAEVRKRFRWAKTIRVYAATSEIAVFWQRQGFKRVGPGPMSSIIMERSVGRGRRNIGTKERTDRPTIKAAPWPPFPSDADDNYCPIHDEYYDKFRSGISYESVAAGMPLAGQSKRAGYQKAHHGDVLRTMGALKTTLWRERHGYCTWDEPERPLRQDDPSTWGEPTPRPDTDLICFQAKGAPKCIIGKRRESKGKGRPPLGGAECRETLSGKYTDQCVTGRTVPTPKRRK